MTMLDNETETIEDPVEDLCHNHHRQMLHVTVALCLTEQLSVFRLQDDLLKKQKNKKYLQKLVFNFLRFKNLIDFYHKIVHPKVSS